MELERTFGSKVAKMLVDDEENSRDVVFKLQRKASKAMAPGVGLVLVQREGMLGVKPFYGKKNASFKNRYFVLKDSFIIWYKKSPSAGNYSMYPEGCLPLGGSEVFPEGQSNGGFVFQVSHPGWNGGTLMLRSKDNDDAVQWLEVLEKCRHATMENALYGDAQAMLLKNGEDQVSAATKDALEAAKAKAQEAAESARAKQELMEANLRKRREQKKTLRERQQSVLQAEKRLNDVAGDLEKKKAAVEHEKEDTVAVQRQLLRARAAVGKLNGILQRSQKMKQAKQIKEDIDNLMSFLDTVIEPQQLDDDDF